MGTTNLIKSSSKQVTADQIASRLIQVTKAPLNKESLKSMKQNLKRTIKELPTDSAFSNCFSLEELESAICTMKTGKAAGMDGIYIEFIKNFKIKAKQWLLSFFNQILKDGNLPRNFFKRAKIIAIVKPGKAGTPPSEAHIFVKYML